MGETGDWIQAETLFTSRNIRGIKTHCEIIMQRAGFIIYATQSLSGFANSLTPFQLRNVNVTTGKG